MSLFEYQLLFSAIVIPTALVALWAVIVSERNEADAGHS